MSEVIWISGTVSGLLGLITGGSGVFIADGRLSYSNYLWRGWFVLFVGIVVLVIVLVNLGLSYSNVPIISSVVFNGFVGSVSGVAVIYTPETLRLRRLNATLAAEIDDIRQALQIQYRGRVAILLREISQNPQLRLQIHDRLAEDDVPNILDASWYIKARDLLR